MRKSQMDGTVQLHAERVCALPNIRSGDPTITNNKQIIKLGIIRDFQITAHLKVCNNAEYAQLIGWIQPKY